MTKKPRKKLYRRIIAGFITTIILLVLIPTFYFLTIISTQPQSFPYVTSKIEEKINQNLSEGASVKIGQATFKLNRLHKISVKFDNVHFISDDKKESVLPKTEVEFSIFNLAVLKIIPSQIKIFAPEIEIDNSASHPKIALNGIDNDENLFQKNSFQNLSQIFLSLKNGKVAIKNFSIIDARINFKNANGSRTINLKESKIATSFRDGYLRLITQNKISFDPKLPDLFINGICQFKENEGLKCDTNFSNFIPASITFIDPKLLPLEKITGNLQGNINFIVDEKYQLTTSSFNASSQIGSFDYPQFFSGKIDFKDLHVSGKFDNALKTISLDKLNCHFGDTKFEMSLMISDFLDYDLQKTVMQFKVNNVPTNNLSLLWPVFLNQQDIRKWVLSNITGGVIKDGYATMSFAYKNGVESLQKIESELAFSGLNLQYDKNFPPISKIDGIAYFNNKLMKIDITNGEVLNSKTNLASVIIPDFYAKKTMLEIRGKVFGAAEDSLKHIGYKTEFAKEISKYFSGKAETNLEIKLPLNNNLQLQDVYMKVLSNIKSFNNDYIKDSNVIVSTVKEFKNNNFVTEVDLTSANLNLKQFNIAKKTGVPSKISAILSFDTKNNLYLKNFSWIQKNENMSGNLTLKTEPLKITELNLKNHNFANSDFNLKYKVFGNSRVLKVRGKSLDLRPIFENDDEDDDSHGLEHYQKNDVDIYLGEIYLANKQKFKDVNIDINCDGFVCQSGFVRAKLNAKENIGIGISESHANEPSKIDGRINDISVLAKAFDLSNQIIGGNAKIKAEIGDGGELFGVIKIDSGFTILKNEVVEKISSTSAFAKIRDKILRSNEIEFDNLKLEFVFKNNVIDIKTLIANSYIMGFTAKGKIDLNKEETFLKGLIVPGYALNKLFGIGRIPILGQIIVGEEGGGIFAIRYDYTKTANKEGNFSINPASAVIPGGIRNIFDLF